MALNPRTDEIVEIIRRQISDFIWSAETAEVGTVIQSGDGIARIFGLDDVAAGEMLAFPHGVKGMAYNLESDHVGAILFGDYHKVREGDTVKRTENITSVPVGESLIGRVVNALGEPVDGSGPLTNTTDLPVERLAPGVIDRQPVNKPLQTGIKAIDSMTPIGKGQRELIIGDRQTGKTAIALDTMINQRGKDVICIYVAIGQKQSTVARLMQELADHGAMKHSIIVTASASEPAPMQYLAPYTGCTIGEYFRDSGRDALVIYDDLSKHAVAYRQLSLLLRRPPGREAYPGDVFYLHSRLLERAAALSEEKGGGTLSALPIIETQAGDVSAYVPTNVISITDGQIYLESSLFHAGIRPAINPGISVSRVGGAAQADAMKKVSGPLRLNLAQFRELQAFAQFGSELDKTAQAQLERGERLVEILKHDQSKPLSVSAQILIIRCASIGLLDDIAVRELDRFEEELFAFFNLNHEALLEELASTRHFDEALKQKLDESLKHFKEQFFCGESRTDG